MAFGKSILKAGIITAVLATTATAQTLPLPDNLINLDSGKGSALLQESEALQSYWPLSIQFVTQKNQAFCGVASIVMVLNALGIPAPTTPEFEPYRTFTQENVFTPATETILPQATVLKMGMTLDQIGAFIATYAVKAKIHHASDSSLEEFRKLAKEYLNASGHHVIVNYLRKSMGQEKGGHISPLAAYDADTDRFLILDVARYKYPPVWVSAADLFAAMNTTDSENQNRTRGFVLVSR
jgi:hypothetical protein